MQNRLFLPPEVLALVRDLKRYVEENGFGGDQVELIERAENLLKEHAT
jgi:hypothetical protein